MTDEGANFVRSDSWQFVLKLPVVSFRQPAMGRAFHHDLYGLPLTELTLPLDFHFCESLVRRFPALTSLGFELFSLSAASARLLHKLPLTSLNIRPASSGTADLHSFTRICDLFTLPLQQLRLEAVQQTATAEQIHKGFSCLRHLTALSLEHCSVVTRGVVHLPCLTSLTDVSIDSVGDDNNDDFQIVPALLQMVSLRRLSVGWLCADDIKALSTALPRLRVFAFHSYRSELPAVVVACTLPLAFPARNVVSTTFSTLPTTVGRSSERRRS